MPCLRVPVVPIQRSRLPAAQAASSSVTLHGITVRLVNVVADRQHTVIQLSGGAAPPIRWVRSLGRTFPPRRVLRDDHGREYLEQQGPGRTFPDAGGRFTDDVQFPALPADVRHAQLTIPFVTVEEPGDATFQVPVAGKQVGDPIPLNGSLTFGVYPLRVTDAEIIEQRGERRLALHVDRGDWRDRRKLVHPGQVLIDGKGVAFQFGSEGDVGQAGTLSVALPEGIAVVTVTFQFPDVAFQGPWKLPVPIPSRR